MDTIYTKAVGVSRENEDGSSRQVIIKKFMKLSTPVDLKREPANAVDPNAISLMIMNPNKIIAGDMYLKFGYLPEDLAHDLAPLLDNNQLIFASVENITGGVAGKETLGVNLKLEIYSLEETKELYEKYGKNKVVLSNSTSDALKKKNTFLKPYDSTWLFIFGAILAISSFIFPANIGPALLFIAIVVVILGFILRKKKTRFISTIFK